MLASKCWEMKGLSRVSGDCADLKHAQAGAVQQVWTRKTGQAARARIRSPAVWTGPAAAAGTASLQNRAAAPAEVLQSSAATVALQNQAEMAAVALQNPAAVHQSRAVVLQSSQGMLLGHSAERLVAEGPQIALAGPQSYQHIPGHCLVQVLCLRSSNST